jgi:hypothetical protein
MHVVGYWLYQLQKVMQQYGRNACAQINLGIVAIILKFGMTLGVFNNHE